MYTLESLKKENPHLADRINLEDVNDVNKLVRAIEDLRQNKGPQEMDNVTIVERGRVWRSNYSLVRNAGRWYIAPVYSNTSIYEQRILYSASGGPFLRINSRRLHINKKSPIILKSDFWCWKGGCACARNNLNFSAMVNNWTIEL